MKQKGILFGLLFAAAILLSGCNMRTVDELYCLPKRSEAYENLQSVIDSAMVGLEYSAPLSGENQQTVQMADLDGDGADEYLLFAKGNAEKPLRIFIFTRQNDRYSLLDTVECTGTAFQQVEYVRMNDAGGMEIIVGRQVSDQVVRSVSVYTLQNGQIEQVMTASYSKFVCVDLDSDGFRELLLLRPGATAEDNGIAELYNVMNGVVERSAEINMSEPAEQIRRIMIGRLNDGYPAVYVASNVDANAIITDVFAVVNGQLTNVSFSNESGTSIQTLRSYYVYADDIDGDGILELPDLITMRQPDSSVNAENQYLIRWYAMCSDGSEVDKKYTYHNYVGGWYMDLGSQLVTRLVVTQRGASYEFHLWNEDGETTEKLFTLHVLTGQKREEQATINNRFVVYRTESTVYSAELEVASGAYGMSRDGIINSFHVIVPDWNTGEI